MIVCHPVLKVAARSNVLGRAPGGCDLGRDEAGDPARPRQWVKHEQIIRPRPLHVSAEFCQGITLQEKAQAPRRVGITGLMVPLGLRIFSAGCPDGTIRAPGMFIP